MTLDFRRRSPPPLFSGRDQLRMLMLLAILGLVFVALRVSARTKTWDWMFPRDRATSLMDHRTRTKTAMSDDSTTTPSVPVTLWETSKPETKNSRKRGHGPVTEPVFSETQQPPSAKDFTRDSTRAPLPPPGALDQSRLGVVLDNTALRLRPQEADAYYYVLDHARSLAPDALESHARRDVLFAQFLADPQAYRGQLVQIEGTLRRVMRYQAGTNDYGLRELYEAWLFTNDAQNHPFVVITTRVPRKLPLGDALSERVRVTGYFFKNNLYRAGDADRIAPMILAPRMVWKQRATPRPRHAVVEIAVALLGITLLGLTVFFIRRQHRLAARRTSHLATFSADALELSAGLPDCVNAELDFEPRSPRCEGVKNESPPPS